jgi:photosystem II stability/assembly factor-like uncharacterized protein
VKSLRLLFVTVLISVLALAQSNPSAPNPTKKSTGKADSDKATDTTSAKKSAAAKDEKSKSEQKSDKDKKDDKKDEAKKPGGDDENKPRDLMSSGTFSGLKFRSIGPAMVSGRVATIAVDPRDRAHYFVGVASGGVWKTENNGTSWTPVFDGEGSYSIGAITIDQKDPNIVWVGTGENNAQRSVSYGDGVYRSDDGGRSWKNMGLKHSEHIGRIAIDPRDSNVVFVAAQGPLWSPGGDRGLYKTTDGGKTWKKVIDISENTGVNDVAIDPSNPDLMYATAWQRRRHVWTMIDGGPESAIYRSTDGGNTWNKVKSGLPNEDLGKITLAIAPSDPSIVYATVEAANRKGGTFRSHDHGATWEKKNNFDVGMMYYGGITVDPKNADRIYLMNTLMQVSDDGGATLRRLGERYKHVDNHVLWIDPNDTNYMLDGCDGGVFDTYDRGANWAWKANLPLSQFYDVDVDNSEPFYYVYGGTQDNNSLGGPSRTTSMSGIMNSDWFITAGGDGFHSAVDPEDPNTVYAESQYGGIIRYDRKTGQRLGIQPEPGKGEPGLRWNWDSPIAVSNHNHNRVYFAANRVFRSDDRGDTWKAISPDLTRQIDRNKLPVMGKIWGPDAVAKNTSTSLYGNIIGFSESPKNENLLYVGTDDGLIQVTENGGGNWRAIDKFPGVPDKTYNTRVLASNHDEKTVYASFDNHKNGDFKPYLLKSTDAGATWTSIASNLPENGPVLAIAEDYVNPKLLFVGTEFGAWFSIDGGGKWIQLKGGLPTIAIRDMKIQKREGDLVLASYGRGFYILDDITPLRQLTTDTVKQEAVLMPVKKTMMYVDSLPFGGRGKAHMGESLYTAENPPNGAIFTYYLKEKYKTLKDIRDAAERAAAKKNEEGPYATMPYPTIDQLRKEAEQEAPSLWMTVTDSNGNIVRRLPAPNNAGFNRIAWDLKYPPVSLRPEQAGEEGIFPWEFGPAGPGVMPGQYTVKLSKKIDGKFTDLSAPQAFTLYVLGADKMQLDDRTALAEFQTKVMKLQRAVNGATGAGRELTERLHAIKRALAQTPADTSALVTKAEGIETQLREVEKALNGDAVARQRQENDAPSLNDRIGSIVGDERTSTAKPTQTDRDDYAIVASDFGGVLAKLKSLTQETQQLEQEMEKIGAPWTPGRLPDWSQQ